MAGKVLLGVSGSIAAYKAAMVASELVRRGHEVRCVLTPGATNFVSPLTFEALTGEPVSVQVWDEQTGSSRMGHLELARWADIVVVAPASAGCIARLALGLTDDMLGAAALASTAPLLLAPAMESAMFAHPATTAHLATLLSRGAGMVGPEDGHLASGATGLGRMSEPAAIVERIEALLDSRDDLVGRRVLVTAGPTYEPIDPVRFIGNRSSGKMGYAIAREAARRGANVTLVSGPTALPDPGVPTVHVETAEEMRQAVFEHLPRADVVVMSAAVADFRPRSKSTEKRRRAGGLTLELEPTDDIAAAAAHAAPNAFHVGFALETHDLMASAREKLERKGLDIVVANAMSSENNPFGSENNLVSFVTRDDEQELPRLSKAEIASRLWDVVIELLQARDEPVD